MHAFPDEIPLVFHMQVAKRPCLAVAVTEMAVQLVSVQCTNDGPRRDLEL